MKGLKLALAATAIVALAACGRENEDVVTDNMTEELQIEELNALADNAAMDAQAEMDALGNQQMELETTEPATTQPDAGQSVTTEPSDVEDDVQGM